MSVGAVCQDVSGCLGGVSLYTVDPKTNLPLAELFALTEAVPDATTALGPVQFPLGALSPYTLQPNCKVLPRCRACCHAAAAAAATADA